MKTAIAIITAAMVVIGYGTDSAATIGIATALLGVGFAATDGYRASEGKVTALSFFSIATFFVGVGDWVIVTRVAAGNIYYLKYGVPQHYTVSAFITYVGALLPHLGGYWAQAMTHRTRRQSLLPVIEYWPRQTFSVVKGLVFVAIVVVVTIRLGLMPRLGKLTNIVILLPAVAVFVLSRWGYSRGRFGPVWVGFGLALFLSIEALFYSYLRGQILFPWIALVFGGYAGRPEKATFRTTPFVIVYGIVLLFCAYFSVMGVVRQQGVTGMKRVSRLIETRRAMDDEGIEGVLGPVMARRGTVNKVSNIERLTLSRGYYMGESMAYYTYVFIPRFLWPGKPIIQRGGWFAHEIGMARERGGNRYTNAINMTIAGEWYLNFGWIGVLLGCTGMGFIIMLFWQSTHFWGSTDNIPGNFMAFILIKRCFEFMGPDMQSLIGYITTYLVMLAATVALRQLFPNPYMAGRGAAPAAAAPNLQPATPTWSPAPQPPAPPSTRNR